MRPVSDSDREHMLARTAGVWDALRGERVFLTGGTGFAGTWLAEAFVAANASYGLDARLVILSRDPARFAARAPHLANDPAVKLLAGDVRDFAFPRERCAFVVHAATDREDDPASEPIRWLDHELAATRRVLDLAGEAAARRVLFVSSGAVYGDQPARIARVPETYTGAPDATDPRTVIGNGKRLCEFLCASAAQRYGFDAVTARLFAFVGPHLPLDGRFAVGSFLADVLARRAIRIAGDGTAVRSYLYAADLAVWLWTILLRGAAGRAYNVGSDRAVSIRQLAELVAATLAPGTPIEIAGRTLPGQAGARYVPSIRRAASELGLRVAIPLPNALRRTYEFQRGTPAANGA